MAASVPIRQLPQQWSDCALLLDLLTICSERHSGSMAGLFGLCTIFNIFGYNTDGLVIRMRTDVSLGCKDHVLADLVKVIKGNLC